MAQVISIERSPRFGVVNPPYAGFTVKSNSTDLLVLIKLPIGENNAPVDVLAQVIAVNASAGPNISLLLDDSDVPRVIRNLVGVTEIPAAYEPRQIGSMEKLVSDHAEALQSVILAGGSRHGNLTLARAIHAITTRDLSADEALQESLSISASVRMLEARLAEKRSQLLNLAA